MMQRIGFILALLLLWLPQPADAQAEHLDKPQAQHGVLDLSRWTLAADGPVSLDGQWEFYWEKLLSPDDFDELEKDGPSASSFLIAVPKTWGSQQIDGVPLSNQGYGTYRLTILLHPADKDRVLALAIPSVATAYSLWIDGQLKDTQGVVGRSRDEMVAHNYTKTVYFAPDPERPEVELVLQVSNFVQRKGGLWDSPSLGLDEQITSGREKNIVVQIVTAGGLFMMGLYHIGLYLFRRNYKPTLWFGAACLLICIRILYTGDFLGVLLWPALPWELAVKLEYVSAYLAIGFLVLYTHSLYPDDMNRKISGGLFGVICAMSVPVVLLPARLYTEGMLPSQIVLIAALLHPVVGVIRAVIRKRPGAAINLGFILLFFATVVNDTLFYNYIVKTGDLLPWGLCLLLFAQTLILASRFSGAFRQVEQLSGQLGETNRTLEEKVKDRTEALRRTNERLQRMEASRKHMLTNIAHEFGTPLTSLIGYISAMKENILPLDADKYKNVLYDKAMLLQRLTEDLKNLVQLEAQQMNLNSRFVDVHTFYASIRDKHEVDLRKQELRFIQRPLNIDGADSLYVNIDMARMDQVIANLFANAIAHTPSGGSMTVTGRYFRLWQKLAISFTDTGTGIPRSETALIFERFYKGSRATKRHRQGSGLGLSIAKEIIGRHGGKIGVRSRLGAGSTFYIVLPVYTEANIQHGQGEQADESAETVNRRG